MNKEIHIAYFFHCELVTQMSKKKTMSDHAGQIAQQFIKPLQQNHDAKLNAGCLKTADITVLQ